MVNNSSLSSATYLIFLRRLTPSFTAPSSCHGENDLTDGKYDNQGMYGYHGVFLVFKLDFCVFSPKVAKTLCIIVTVFVELETQ